MEHLAREISSSGVKDRDLPFCTEDLMISEISEGIAFLIAFAEGYSRRMLRKEWE